MNTGRQDEIQQVIEQEGLSPRDQNKKKKKTKHAGTSNSALTATAKRSINTRSKTQIFYDQYNLLECKKN